MVTYQAKSYGVKWFPTSDVNCELVFRDVGAAGTGRTFAIGDVVQFFQVERGLKITGARVANNQVDSNGSPTATGVLELTDGTTTITLVSVVAATLGAAAGGITSLSNPAALGYVIQTRGFWVQFRFTAAVATATTTAILTGAVGVTLLNYGSEDPTTPT